MQNKIIAITDYKKNFGSKWNATPYRSGMDKNILKSSFSELNFNIEYIIPSEYHKISNQNIVIYTATEDIGFHYKDYLEDVIHYAEQIGALVLPSFKYLRATNNKILMEFIRKSHLKDVGTLDTKIFGCAEEAFSSIHELQFPQVIKKSAGAMSRGVFLAREKKEFIKIVKQISRTPDLKNDLKDYLRRFKHKNYVQESRFRSKFITQQYIPNLSHDYKILVFGDRYFIFERPVRKNDFRASGSGNKNYIYGSKVKFPVGIFEFAKQVTQALLVPQLSIDIAYDDSQFYLMEFQAVYFGTVGFVKSDGYYTYNDKNELTFKPKNLTLEKAFAESVDYFIKTYHE